MLVRSYKPLSLALAERHISGEPSYHCLQRAQQQPRHPDIPLIAGVIEGGKQFIGQPSAEPARLVC